jgi:exodeoxyribonuclease VII large subunit
VKVEHIMVGERKVFSVAAFNRGIATWLGRLPVIWIEGEMTELRRSDAWATVFFTLKDPATGATLRATMARRKFDALAAEVEDGAKVHVEGRAELYEARGDLAFRATTIERVGLGDHLARIERLKRTLAAEGLFAAERKKPLPRFPRAVGLLTGRDAAVRGDVEKALAARYPLARLIVCETRVQGTGASAAIVRGLEALSAQPEVDVLVLARGGGSFEDILPFSDEGVVRAVAACAVPVVSAVGHEQDTPLCDLAADARASTPTAAVRLVVPDLAELRSGMRILHERLGRCVLSRVERDRDRLGHHHRRLCALPPLAVERRRARLDQAGARLQALSPAETLRRGYAVVRHDGRALRDAAHVTVGAGLEIQLAAGQLSVEVREARADASGSGSPA